MAAFAVRVAEKSDRGGDAEDQLRGPLEELLRQVGRHIGINAIPYGEVRLSAVRARPDFAVDVGGTRVGYVELKAPGHGVPSTWRRKAKRERLQWDKLKALPNVLYSDGVTWARYSYGELSGQVVQLEGDLSGRRHPLRPVGPEFEILLRDFLLWKPEQPRTLAQLIQIVAGLCRLLRDEVAAVLGDPTRDVTHEELSLLAADWRDLLFPGLDDVGFADAYAQTVTFALLLARIGGDSVEETPLHEVARQLTKRHSLMGRALSVLTDNDAAYELRTINTLSRVIGCVDWGSIDNSRGDPHADLYERFLATYDPALRRRSGSFYTPQPVAGAIVDFVDEILRDQERFGRSWGVAAHDVTVVDPAMGTGTFLVEVLRAASATVDAKQGAGARGPWLREFFQHRLVGFEIQAAPYAVAELRLHQAMRIQFGSELPEKDVRFLTDALEDPVKQQGRLRAAYRVIEQSRMEANRIKREVPVMVVLGNPPHVENTMGRAPWIEERRKVPLLPGSHPERPSLDEFRFPEGGRYESDLYGLPWCFWRWALWKAFEAHPVEPQGIVAFITPASFIKGKSFEGMREYLRRTCDEGWIVELSPEGNRPQQQTRMFGPEVGRQLCLAVFARYGSGDVKTSAVVWSLALTGSREEKLRRLQELHLADPEWRRCADGWRTPFLPESNSDWHRYPSLKQLFPESSRGVTAGRTWIYAPDLDTLQRRWRRFVGAGEALRRRMLPESRDRTLETVVRPLPGFPAATGPLSTESGPAPPPERVAYRSFDRQWVLPDSRLMVMPRPPLWAVRSPHQIYLTEQNSQPIDSGPGVTFTHLIPDLHHYNGRSGRVFPLYCDISTERPNVTPRLCEVLSESLGLEVTAEDVMAYVAAIAAHPYYTKRFSEELQHPGVRIPLTAEASLWQSAVSIGREVLWLHTFGKAGADEQRFREFVDRSAPKVLVTIPDAPGALPGSISWDDESATLLVGAGRIAPVDRRVWEYDVGGMRVIRHWFNYRCANQRHRRRSSPLDDEELLRWSAGLTEELLEIIAVLGGCVALEPRQSELLARVCASRLISVEDLTVGGALPVQGAAKLATQDEYRIPRLF